MVHLEQTLPVLHQRRRRIGRHWFIVSALLLIPLSVVLYGYWPQYYSFTAPGEIVPVRDIGVYGSVHFVYVQEGVARNRYERLSIKMAYPEAQFTRTDSTAVEELEEMEDVGEELRNETIKHAIDALEELSGAGASEEESDARLSELIEETSEFYGDSIGLMLGLGLLEETLNEDFSDGGRLRIAGTGTLEADHTVGSVGAVPDKLRTAEAAGATIFLVPKDKETFLYEGPSNEEEALQAAKELNPRLRIIPVSSLEEAADKLRKLR